MVVIVPKQGLRLLDPRRRSVERFSTRPPKPLLGFTHPFGYTLKWHNGSSTTSFLRYTLAPGERRSESTEWRIKEAV